MFVQAKFLVCTIQSLMLPKTRFEQFFRESWKMREALKYVTSFGTLGMALRICIFLRTGDKVLISKNYMNQNINH